MLTFPRSFTPDVRFRGKQLSDTVTLTKALARRVELLSVAMQRTPQAILKSAPERGLDYEEWVLRQVDAGIAEADRGELIDQAQVEDDIKKPKSNPKIAQNNSDH